MTLLREEWEAADWIHPARARVQWLALVKTALTFRFHKIRSIS
jgi:hypothetical protein